MPPGVYQFEIQAIDATNQNVTVTPLMSAKVTGVSFKDNSAHLITELQTVALDDVRDVSETPPSAKTVTTYSESNSNEKPHGGL